MSGDVFEEANSFPLGDVGQSMTIHNQKGFIVVNNFSSVLNSTANSGTIPMSSQVRVYGSNSSLGNPVDVSYDYKTKNIYVAERLNGGGKLLTFSLPTVSADATPTATRNEAGISSVYLLRK